MAVNKMKQIYGNNFNVFVSQSLAHGFSVGHSSIAPEMMLLAYSTLTLTD